MAASMVVSCCSSSWCGTGSFFMLLLLYLFLFRIFIAAWHDYWNNIFVAVFLGCTSTGRVDLCFLWFYVQELPKAQPAVVLVLKRLRRRDNGLKSHPTDWEKPGIEPATPGLQDIGLSPTPRRLLTTEIIRRTAIKLLVISQ